MRVPQNHFFDCFAHKMYSHSFITLTLNHWCHMVYFNESPYYLSVPLNVVAPLLSMEGQKALRFHQKYRNLCSEAQVWINMRVRQNLTTLSDNILKFHAKLPFKEYFKISSLTYAKCYYYDKHYYFHQMIKTSPSELWTTYRHLTPINNTEGQSSILEIFPSVSCH